MPFCARGAKRRSSAGSVHSWRRRGWDSAYFISEKVRKRIQEQLRAGKGIIKVAREVGVGTGTVQRIRDDMKGPFDAAA